MKPNQPALRSSPKPRLPARPKDGGFLMLGWALTFLVIALIAAVLGFGGIAGAAIGIAKIIFFVAIILFLISAVAGAVRGRRSI
jgi:uncharacterized membrane protein YtjA (UPF0391 family)